MFAKETHILVVDDSSNIRRVIQDQLKQLGYNKITLAEDAQEAMAKVTALVHAGDPVQLILSDLNMPGPNGLEFLKQIRSMPGFEKMPFLLVTTESEKGAVLQAAMHGVSAYVVKPFNLETLAKRLLEAYKKHNS